MSMQHLKSKIEKEENFMAEATKISIKSVIDKLNEETQKIGLLAKHISESPKFIKKIYQEEKVYEDGSTTTDKWFQFKEEIIYLYESYNTLLPILNNAFCMEVEAMREANHFINELYEMIMCLDFKISENPENRLKILQRGLENIKVVCTYQYCNMSMNELERKTKRLQKKNPDVKTKKIEIENENREIATDYHEEFMNFYKKREENKQQIKEAYHKAIASPEERKKWQEKLENELEECREKILNRKSNIKTQEDWRNLEIYIKVRKQNYSWFISENEKKVETNVYLNELEFLMQCIDIGKQKYYDLIDANNLSEIMSHIETLYILYDTTQTIKALEKLAELKNDDETVVTVTDCLGQSHQILVAHVEQYKELDKKQKELYIAYQEAIEFMNAEREINQESEFDDSIKK